MADIHIERAHRFGLAHARELAAKWTDDAEHKFQMSCSIEPGPTSDTVHFERAGVTGTVLVEADRFTLDAKLGFLYSAFSPTIQAELEKQLDALLASVAPPPAVAVKKPAATSARKRPKA